jgi:hypothetical protein
MNYPLSRSPTLSLLFSLYTLFMRLSPRLRVFEILRSLPIIKYGEMLLIFSIVGQHVRIAKSKG